MIKIDTLDDATLSEIEALERITQLRPGDVLLLLVKLAGRLRVTREAARLVCEDAIPSGVPEHSSVQDRLLVNLKKFV